MYPWQQFGNFAAQVKKKYSYPFIFMYRQVTYKHRVAMTSSVTPGGRGKARVSTRAEASITVTRDTGLGMCSDSSFTCQNPTTGPNSYQRLSKKGWVDIELSSFHIAVFRILLPQKSENWGPVTGKQSATYFLVIKFWTFEAITLIIWSRCTKADQSILHVSLFLQKIALSGFKL